MKTKWQDRGYWVSHHFYWQSLVHYLIYAIRYRSFTFFSASNPAIPFGGMLDESKTDVEQLIPAPYRVKGFSLDTSENFKVQLFQNAIDFPIIIKPDIGLKGYAVRKLDSLEEAVHHIATLDNETTWLVQEFVPYDKGFSILYYRNRKANTHVVLSLIEKRYPIIIGDGQSSIGDLILALDNPFLDHDWLKTKWHPRWHEVLASGQQLVIDNVGNYSRGASFHSMMEFVDQDFSNTVHKLFEDFKGVDFFRADLKADDLQGFLEGHFSIIEINGAKGEPLHIYDRKHRFISNTKDIFRHWKQLSQVSSGNHSYGAKYPSFWSGIKALKAIKVATS